MKEQILQSALKRCRKDGTVRSAKVACIAIAPDYVSITVNKRGKGGRISPWTYHAEELMLNRIRNARWPYPGACTIIVMRFKPDGTLGCAKPCDRCDPMLRKSGVRRVIYTNEVGILERLF